MLVVAGPLVIHAWVFLRPSNARIGSRSSEKKSTQGLPLYGNATMRTWVRRMHIPPVFELSFANTNSMLDTLCETEVRGGEPNAGAACVTSS